jgi:hypothetical protein
VSPHSSPITAAGGVPRVWCGFVTSHRSSESRFGDWVGIAHPPSFPRTPHPAPPSATRAPDAAVAASPALRSRESSPSEALHGRRGSEPGRRAAHVQTRLRGPAALVVRMLLKKVTRHADRGTGEPEPVGGEARSTGTARSIANIQSALRPRKGLRFRGGISSPTCPVTLPLCPAPRPIGFSRSLRPGPPPADRRESTGSCLPASG